MRLFLISASKSRLPASSFYETQAYFSGTAGDVILYLTPHTENPKQRVHSQIVAFVMFRSHKQSVHKYWLITFYSCFNGRIKMEAKHSHFSGNLYTCKVLHHDCMYTEVFFMNSNSNTSQLIIGTQTLPTSIRLIRIAKATPSLTNISFRFE